MSAIPTLIYIDTGRANPIRQMFAIAGMEYEDVCLTDEQMAQRKHEFPYGLVPVLKIGDRTLPESVAIGRYVARLTGMLPEDAFEAAVVDQFVHHTEDIINAITLAVASPDINVESYSEKLGATMLPKMLGDIERQLEQHTHPFLTGPKVSYADLWLVNTLEWIADGSIPGVPGDMVDRFPRLSEVRRAVTGLPAVKRFYEAPGMPTSA